MLFSFDLNSSRVGVGDGFLWSVFFLLLLGLLFLHANLCVGSWMVFFVLKLHGFLFEIIYCNGVFFHQVLVAPTISFSRLTEFGV